jgi:hypothetical protein
MANRPQLSDVLKSAQAIIDESAAEDRAPTIVALSERTGVVRAALYSIYPEAVELIQTARKRAGLAATGRPRDKRALEAEGRARRARRDADQSEAAAATYAEAIRFLTEQNARLARELEVRAAIPRIGHSTTASPS